MRSDKIDADSTAIECEFMLGWLRKATWWKEKAEFWVDASPEDAAQQLDQHQGGVGDHEYVGGFISPNRVCLWHWEVAFRNSFRPVFSGKFVVEDGRTVLRGRFRLMWLTRVFIAVWFGMALLGTVMPPIDSVLRAVEAGKPWVEGFRDGFGTSIFALGLMLIGFLIVAGGRWNANDDVEVIRRHVASRLTQANGPK